MEVDRLLSVEYPMERNFTAMLLPDNLKAGLFGLIPLLSWSRVMRTRLQCAHPVVLRKTSYSPCPASMGRDTTKIRRHGT